MSRTLRKTTLVAALAWTLVGLVATPAGAGHGGSASNQLDVVGTFSTVGFEGLISDVWAFGNYAYLGSFQEPLCSFDITGVRIIDISDPSNPTQVGFIKAKAATRNNDVKVDHIETPNFTGEILVVSNEPCSTPFNPRLESNGKSQAPGRGGLSIYDVTDPLNPVVLKGSFMKKFGVHNTFTWQDGSNAYMMVVDDDNLLDTHILDITDPTAPKEIAVTGAPEWPGLGFGEIQGPNNFIHDMWVQDNGAQTIAYLSYWDAGLVLLDVTDPDDPVFLGDSEYPTPDPVSGLPVEGNGHVSVPTEDGQMAILGDEDQSPFSAFLEFTETGDGDAHNFKVGQALFGPEDNFAAFQALLPADVVDTGGLGCTTGAIPPATADGQIALIERGTCFFSEKAFNAEQQGYDGYIVYNNAAGGEGLINMSAGTDDPVTIPGLFVGRSSGLTMRDNPGQATDLDQVYDGWGYMHVLDVSDPASPVQLGHFATENVFNPAFPSEGDDRTAHNVMIRDDIAYWSWYYEGIRVVDFSSCEVGGGEESCTPTEIAHFVDDGDDTDSATDVTLNDHSNFWGVYLHDHPDGNTYILGSDRDSGLWIFETP